VRLVISALLIHIRLGIKAPTFEVALSRTFNGSFHRFKNDLPNTLQKNVNSWGIPLMKIMAKMLPVFSIRSLHTF